MVQVGCLTPELLHASGTAKKKKKKKRILVEFLFQKTKTKYQVWKKSFEMVTAFNRRLMSKSISPNIFVHIHEILFTLFHVSRLTSKFFCHKFNKLQGMQFPVYYKNDVLK